MPVCILVADSGRARIFRVRGNGRARVLEELEDLVSPIARLARRSLVSDKSGRAFPRASRSAAGRNAARSGVDDDADPRKTEAARFAARVARRLDAHRRAGAFDELRIAAAPRFLGTLRQKISIPTRRVVTRESSRDLSRAKPDAIARAMFER